MWRDWLLEKNILPDTVIRLAIRSMLKKRIQDISFGDKEAVRQYKLDFVKMLKQKPIAVNTAEANEQHYELPTAFFQRVLGNHLKYSCGLWNDETLPMSQSFTKLDQSEEDMLAKTCERAQLVDGQKVLELGCGWGSLSLYMASHYPGSQITVVSNSKTQKSYIDQQAIERGLSNLKVITEDMNTFYIEDQFDRIVSLEMFEHMQNYQKLLARLATFLKPDGKLFVHIFTHRESPYLFEIQDDSDWMAKYFFTGGMMPSRDLFSYFEDDFVVEEQWVVNGIHYQKTCEAWLQKMDQQKKEIYPMLAETYGQAQATKWWVYWRVFFMACAELFGYDEGKEWFVSHYLLSKPNAEV